MSFREEVTNKHNKQRELIFAGLFCSANDVQARRPARGGSLKVTRGVSRLDEKTNVVTGKDFVQSSA
jgi:hypothetical protein